MVGHLSSRRVMLGSALLLCSLVEAAAVRAQNLADPTKPPAGNTSTSLKEDAVLTGPVLQSVLISPGRRVAVISGRTVTIGDDMGGARVTRITETEVVLKAGKEVQMLKLFPDVEKKRASDITQLKPLADGQQGK